MKKIRNMFATIISFVLIITCMTTVASAAEFGTPESHTAVPIYVNNQQVIGANAYADQDGNLWVTYSDVYKIFPQETATMKLPETTAETSLKGWVYAFGYNMSISHNGVLLEKSSTTQPTPEVPTTPTVPTTPEVTTPVLTPTPNIPDVTVVKVYVNGLKVETSDVYLDGNTIKVGSVSTISTIFPEAKKVNMTNTTETILERWASNFGYKFVQKGIRVYLNNNNQKPLEVVLGDTIMDYPDQQPIIVSGRTLVPVRTLAESIGCQVGYDNGKVTITNGERTITLWINSTTYTINGVEKVMDVPAKIYNGRTLVPIRFVTEAFNYTVGFNGNGTVNVVTLTK